MGIFVHAAEIVMVLHVGCLCAIFVVLIAGSACDSEVFVMTLDGLVAC
jgi:hypothetical protein